MTLAVRRKLRISGEPSFGMVWTVRTPSAGYDFDTWLEAIKFATKLTERQLPTELYTIINADIEFGPNGFSGKLLLLPAGWFSLDYDGSSIPSEAIVSWSIDTKLIDPRELL